MKKTANVRAFRTAKEELRKKSLPKRPFVQQPSYEVAFTDNDFLLRRELRPVRLQLELLKTELCLHDQQINSTVVIFGSARIPDPTVANERLAAAKRKLLKNPLNAEFKKRVAIAERVVKKSQYYEQARLLGSIISSNCQRSEQRDFVVVTGGGPGIMEAANRGAHDVGGKSIGLNIVLPFEQDANHYITPTLHFQFHYFAIRKMHLLIRTRAMVFFPGGYGTLDELFESLTLIQTQKIKPIPVLLFGKEYWSRVINFDVLVEEGVINSEDLGLFQYVETAQEAWEIIAEFYQLKVEKR